MRDIRRMQVGMHAKVHEVGSVVRTDRLAASVPKAPSSIAGCKQRFAAQLPVRIAETLGP